VFPVVTMIDVGRTLQPKLFRCTKNGLKGTVSPDYKCLEVISIKSPLLGHVTPDIYKN
jgi:hypothetical protein